LASSYLSCVESKVFTAEIAEPYHRHHMVLLFSGLFSLLQDDLQSLLSNCLQKCAQFLFDFLDLFAFAQFFTKLVTFSQILYGF
jgi:hypothetical protein